MFPQRTKHFTVYLVKRGREDFSSDLAYIWGNLRFYAFYMSMVGRHSLVQIIYILVKENLLAPHPPPILKSSWSIRHFLFTPYCLLWLLVLDIFKPLDKILICLGKGKDLKPDHFYYRKKTYIMAKSLREGKKTYSFVKSTFWRHL